MSELKPGRELDALIAEKVMGGGSNTMVGNYEGYDSMSGRDDPPSVLWSSAPKNYSTDIAAAWEVVEKLKSQEWERDSYKDAVTGLQITLSENEVRIMDQHWNTWEASSGESIAHSICLAALKVVEQKEFNCGAV